MSNKLALLSLVICHSATATATASDQDPVNKYNIPKVLRTGFVVAETDREELAQAELEQHQHSLVKHFIQRFHTVVSADAMQMLPREITNSVPPVIINSCDFKSDDSAYEKAMKLSRLALEINNLDFPEMEEYDRDHMKTVAFVMTANSFAKVAEEAQENAADMWVTAAQYMRWSIYRGPQGSKKHFLQQAANWDINAFAALNNAPEELRVPLRDKITEEIQLLQQIKATL